MLLRIVNFLFKARDYVILLPFILGAIIGGIITIFHGKFITNLVIGGICGFVVTLLILALYYILCVIISNDKSDKYK